MSLLSQSLTPNDIAQTGGVWALLLYMVTAKALEMKQNRVNGRTISSSDIYERLGKLPHELRMVAPDITPLVGTIADLNGTIQRLNAMVTDQIATHSKLLEDRRSAEQDQYREITRLREKVARLEARLNGGYKQ